VEEARREARRTVLALAPFVARGARIAGIEPSCLLTFRDEFAALLPEGEIEDVSRAALLPEELLDRDVPFRAPVDGIKRIVHLHSHCHQKAFGTAGAVAAMLGRIPGVTVKAIPSSCCGMAGAFGYGAETIDVSLAMGELSLLPAIRKAAPDEVIVADGVSCRHQIRDGTGREAISAIALLDRALRAWQ
jgi:Fe-S oxidoreductase